VVRLALHIIEAGTLLYIIRYTIVYTIQYYTIYSLIYTTVLNLHKHKSVIKQFYMKEVLFEGHFQEIWKIKNQ
jgi:hypothetical protein